MVPNRIYKWVRAIGDRLAAAVVLILVSPILLVAALLVALDGGPIIFRQDRLGKNAKVFRVFKLRTMVVDADRFLDDKGMPTRKRTTLVGPFLRKTSIDELPQLLNIIKGDMALVEPRPILPRMLPYMTASERKRFTVLPGVTGLAQIKGRNTQIWSRRFRYDVFYARHLCFALDLYIVGQTIKMVLGAKDITQDVNRDQVDDVTTRPLKEQAADG